MIDDLREAWDAPAPRQDLRDRVLKACNRELRGRPRAIGRRMAVAALLAVLLAVPHPVRDTAVPEVVTVFYPLLDTSPQFDHAALLRVTVPASMVQIAGYPLREDQINDGVEADVLVGDDGVAQAIRFVNLQF